MRELSALVDQASKGINSEYDMADAIKFIRKSFYDNALNGHSPKTVYSDSRALQINTHRD